MTPYEQQFCEELRRQILPLIEKYLYEKEPEERRWSELREIIVYNAPLLNGEKK